MQGYLLYPVYADNRLVIPAGSILRGSVVMLNSDRNHRIHSRLWGDFTPFHVPVVEFDQLVLPDGSVQPIVSENATDGAPVLHLSAAPARTRRSFLSQQLPRVKQRVKDTAALVTAPGRRDRLVQTIYKQLPYHPERIESGTAWTVQWFFVSASRRTRPTRANLATARLSRSDHKFRERKARGYFRGCRC